MSGIEAPVAFGLVTGAMGLISSAIQIYQAANGDGDERIKKVARHLPSILSTLEEAQKRKHQHDSVWKEVASSAEMCKQECEALRAIFEKVFPTIEENKVQRAWKTGVMLFKGKRSEAEEHLAEILRILNIFQAHHIVENTKLLEEMKATLDEIDAGDGKIVHTGAGNNNVNWSTGSYYQQNGPNSNFEVIHTAHYAAPGSIQNNYSYPPREQTVNVSFFRVSDYESYKDRLNPRRAENTCQWFLGHQKFTRWKSSDHDDFLWLSADPGCGKSVLSRALIDEQLVSNGHDPVAVIYFFFKDNNEQSANTTAVCALLHQLLQLKPQLFERYAVPAQSNDGDSLKQNFEALWKLLLLALNDPDTGSVVCILDALDECRQQDRSRLLEKLDQIYKTACAATSDLTKTSTVKFLVTSRPYQHLLSHLDDGSKMFPSIHLAGEHESKSIQNEITRVILDEFEKIGRKFIQDEYQLAKSLQLFLTKENRTYLWWKFALEEVSKFTPTTAAEVMALIQKLPVGVEEAYEEILARCPDRAKAERILQIVLAAVRPLTVREMDVALAIDPGMRTDKHLMLAGAASRALQIRNLCGLFVVINDSKIYLIHQTAREFLVSRLSDKASGQGWLRSMEMVDCHRVLAEICIKYLLLDEYRNLKGRGADDTHDMARAHHWNITFGHQIKEFPDKHELLLYAATQWTIHLAKAISDKNDVLTHAAVRLYENSHSDSLWARIAADANLLYNDTPWDWPVFVFPSMEPGFGSTSAPSLPVFSLQFMAYFGHSEVLSVVYRRERFGGQYNDALCVAAIQGHAAIVKTLIGLDAKIEARLDLDGALVFASGYGHVDVARLLIHKGANVNADHGSAVRDVASRSKFGALGSDQALHVATIYGHEDVVRLLLEFGAKVNFYGGVGSRDLLFACERHENFDIVKLLLDAGEYSSNHDMLRAAAAAGDMEVVQLLLDFGVCGADACFEALRWAVMVEHAELVEYFEGHLVRDHGLVK